MKDGIQQRDNEVSSSGICTYGKGLWGMVKEANDPAIFRLVGNRFTSQFPVGSTDNKDLLLSNYHRSTHQSSELYIDNYEFDSCSRIWKYEVRGPNRFCNNLWLNGHVLTYIRICLMRTVSSGAANVSGALLSYEIHPFCDRFNGRPPSWVIH